MTVPNERDDEKLLGMFTTGADGFQPADQESSEAFAAYQKVEALFDLLRRPATAVEASTADDLAPGKVLGEFAILRPLATGGMGHVYLARQQSLGRLVALKVCKPEFACDPRMKSRFMAEGQSLARLSHPNVVPVLSTGEDQSHLYLAMEYVGGPTLAQVLQAIQGAGTDSLASAVVARVLASPDSLDQSQPWGKGHARLDRAYQTWVIQMLKQVAQGLAAAHEAGILHRDIKPANIVFAANGVPKIVDFGLARTARGPSTTVIGEFYGTPAYTSPEQARGDAEAVSPASDVFSFGVTLFECLSLDHPFPGKTSVDVLNAVLNSDPPLLRKVEKKITWELEAITDKCLRKTPAERYPSAQALADDLRNYLELRPVSARSTSKLAKVGRMIRRRPWDAAFLFALVCATAFGIFSAKHAWEENDANQIKLAKHERAEYEADQLKTFAKRVDEGDAALFRCLTGQRPTWLPEVIEQYRQKGINAYSAALEIDPSAVRPLVQRARLYASTKENLELALADLARAQQIQPGFGSIRKFRGFVLDKLGRKEEGRSAKEEAKGLYPGAVEDLYWLGVLAYSTEQDFIACYTYFSQALLIATNDYWSRLERAYFGQLPSEDNARQRVIPELQIAKTIRPDLPFASELLERFYSKDRSHGQIDPLRQKKELEEQIGRFGLDILRAHQMSDLLQEEKRYDEAEAILHKILDQDIGGRTAEKIGDLEYRIGHFEQARDWYRRAISQGMRYPLIYISFASSCTAMNDLRTAETAYMDGIAENPRAAFLYQSLGFWYHARGRVADAENTYRKACELPCDFEASSQSLAEASLELQNLTSSYQQFALFLRLAGRHAESVQVLERGIAKLEKGLASTNAGQPQKAQLIEDQISKLKGNVGEAYLYEGRRQDALSLIDSELKEKPLRSGRVGMVMNLLRPLGMEQRALNLARLGEYTSHHDAPSSDRSSRQLAGSVVDGQLQRMGLFNELRDRLETKRALGEELEIMDYRWLGTTIYQGAEAVAILDEGVKKHPEAMTLQTDYMEVLIKAGRKEEAWQAYEKARDLYFALVDRTEIPASAGDGYITEPLTVLIARPWYLFLMQEGKDDELRRLEARLREICPKTKDDAKSLLLPRAFAEFGSGRYAAAVQSLEACVQMKIWNELVSEAMVNITLARSLRALGRRHDAITWYRRAVQMSGVDPGLLSEFLLLVAVEQGANGLQGELAVFSQMRLRREIRLNATLSCFSAWAALATGDEKTALENLIEAGPYVHLASQQLGQPKAVQSAGGNLVYEKTASLDKKDPTVPSLKDSKLTSHRKTYTFKMKAGFTYTIDLISSDNSGKKLDPFLLLESPDGKQLAEDDDGAGFPNSRIVYKAIKDGDYRIIATSFAPNQTGAFTLKVFEAEVKDAFVSGNFGADEGLICGVILQIVSEKLADSKRLAEATELLRRFPADRVRTMKEVFLLPKQK